VTVNPGDEGLESEYETTRDSWKNIRIFFFSAEIRSMETPLGVRPTALQKCKAYSSNYLLVLQILTQHTDTQLPIPVDRDRDIPGIPET